jgi:hypothetical protein
VGFWPVVALTHVGAREKLTRMKASRRARFAALSVCSLTAAYLCSVGDVHAGEGQWTPDQIEKLDAKKLKELGLELSAKELWNADGDEKTGGLMRAAVNLSGCSAAFISNEGLIATNHHCAYGALQANSTPEHDYLHDGFVARSRSEELPAKGRSVKVLRKQSDVTKQIRDVADAAKDDTARDEVIDRTSKQIVDTCEAAGEGISCQVASFYNGSEYRLFEYVEFRDVRVVYAPPASVGEYGGEVDNWMWPRHTGDFALLRAYATSEQKPAEPADSNVPYKPAKFLEVSTDGVSEGDFVAILGYPGRTQRYLSAAEVKRNIEQILPGIVDLYGEWISILEAQAKRDEAVKIKVAATKKSLANRHKNSRGMLAGLDHMKLLDKRSKEEAELKEWTKGEGREAYKGVLGGLTELSDEARATHDADFLLGALYYGPRSFAIAIDLVRNAQAKTLPDLERPYGFRDRDQKRLWSRQEGRLRDYDLEVDVELMASVLSRVAKLDAAEGAKPDAWGELSKVVASKGGEPGNRRAFMGRARTLVSGSSVQKEEELKALWDSATPASLAKSKDPLIEAAVSLVARYDEREARNKKRGGALARLRPKYFEMLRELREGPIYPDANSTLRFSYATVRGYDKWDGAKQTPQSTLGEAVAKHTGAEPFDLPAKVRQKAPAAKHTYWSDPTLGDLPLCFMSDGDTTGGNSGSPVIDGKGRLVGFNFDRVWENIAGDFAYFDGHSRNISADARHLLWMLDEVDDAAHILEEIGVAKYKDAPAKPTEGATAPVAEDAKAEDAPAEPKADADAGPAAEPEKKGLCSIGGEGSASGLGLLALIGLIRRRRNDSTR